VGGVQRVLDAELVRRLDADPEHPAAVADSLSAAITEACAVLRVLPPDHGGVNHG